MSYVQVDKLSVLIEAQAGQFKREMAELQKLTNKVGSGMTGSLMKANLASQVLIGTFKTLGRASFNMGKQLVNLGSQYSRLKIATDTVARNMGMSTEEVNNLRTALEETNTYGSQAENAIKSLAMSGLMDMAKSLKFVDARSGDTEEGINALVLAMKDLGAAAGIRSANAIDRVTKFVRRGNVALADGLIEVGNMNREYREFANSLGKSYQSLTQEELAQARLNIVMREANKTLGAYANTMQTSGKAMDSIKDASVSLLERLGNYLEPLFASVTRAVFQFVDNVRSALIGNEEAFRAWANSVAAYVVAVVRILGTLLTRITLVGKYFENLTNFSLKPVVATMDKLNESASGGASAMDTASESARKLKKELLGLAGFDEMNILSKKEGSGGVGVGGVNVGGAGVDLGELMDVESLNENVDLINAMADEIEKELREKLEGIMDSLQPLLDILKPIAQWFWDNKKPILLVAGALFLVKKAIDVVVGAFAWFRAVGGVLSVITGSLSSAFQSVFIWALYAKEAILGALSSVFKSVVIWVLYAKKAIVAFVGSINPVVLIIGLVIAALIALEVILIKNWEAISNWLTGIAKSLLEGETLIGGVVGSLITFFVDLNDILLDFWGRVWESVKAIEGALTAIITPFKGVNKAKRENKQASKDLELAEQDLKDATKDLQEAQEDLTIASGNLADAQLSLMDANDRVAKAQVEVTRLEKEGKQGTKEYERATLELTSAKGRQVTAEQRVAKRQEKVNATTEAVSSATQNLTEKTNEVTNATNRLQKSQNNLSSKQAESVGERIRRKWEELKDTLGGIWDGFGSSARNSLNNVISYINRFFGRIRGRRIPILFPSGFNLPNIPYLAKGGIIEHPTFAHLGENGKEAVVPLERNTEWIGKLAGMINEQGGANGGRVNYLTIKIGEKDFYKGFIDYFNDRSVGSNSKLLKM